MDLSPGINRAALRPKRGKNLASIAMVLLPLIGCVAFGIWYASRPIPEPKRTPLKGPGGVLLSEHYGEPMDPQTQTMAVNLAQQLILKSVKWPDDAEFVGQPDLVIHSKWDCGFEIRGKIKLANGFGAHLTHNYTAQIALHDAPRHDWKCHLLMIGDEIIVNE